MRWSQKLRHLWHNLYYKLAGSKATEFALCCQQAVEQVDLPSPARSWKDTFRFYLHLSVCQACSNYFKMSRGFNWAIKKTLRQESQSRLSHINSELLKKHGKKPSRHKS